MNLRNSERNLLDRRHNGRSGAPTASFARRLAKRVPVVLFLLTCALHVSSQVRRDYNKESLAPAVTVNVFAPTMNATVGSDFTIPITVSDLTGAGVRSFQIIISFNQNVIIPQASPVDTSGTISSGMFVIPNATNPGQLTVSFSGVSPTPLSGAGVLFNLKFKAVGSVGLSSGLIWQAFMFNEGDPVAAPANGQVTISGTTAAMSSIGGRILNSSGRGVSSARVVLTDDSGNSRVAISNPFGYYQFDGVESGSAYILAATHKQYTFQSQIVSVFSDLVEADLTAIP